MDPVKAGIVGCGNISGIYFENLCKVFRDVTVVACADLEAERAEAKAEAFPGVKVLSLEEMLADEAIEIIVNLTTPQGHFPLSRQAVTAGKSVYCEKPVALTREDAATLLAAARETGVRVGNAPDTFMGAGIQTCRKLIDDGWIGRPVAATAFMTCHGHESWHPDPEFYYKAGGGPMFDMGPYYLTALVALLGPVKRVAGATAISFPERVITSEKKYGTRVKVEVPTHVAGTMDFASGVIGTMVTSFDVWGAHLPCIEIHGTEGSMTVPDPNGFGGNITVKRAGAKEFTPLPHTHKYPNNARGIGVADMACGLRSGRPHRASGELATHVLDIMHAFHDSSDNGRYCALQSRCERPDPMPMNPINGSLGD